MQVGDVIVHRAVVLHGVGCTIGIIEEVNGIGSPGHAHQLAAGVIIAVSGAAHSLAGSQSAGIVGEAQAVGSVGGRRQAPAVLPRHCPPGAVAVAGGIAYGVVDNRLPVKKTGEQILPVGITVGVAVGGGAIGGGQNVACAVVGIGVGGIPCRTEQLSPVVIGVADFCTVSAGLLNQLVNAVVIDVCDQSPAAYLGGEHIAKAVVGEAVGLGFSIIGSLDRG